MAYANGVPCEDTFRQVFSGLSRVAFERCFIGWAGAPVSEPRGPARRD
ncbi:MAG: transposase family protein [Burkholderia sp.]